MNTKSIQFESMLHKQIYPLDRLACVVNVSKLVEEPNEPSVSPANPRGQVRVDLADGTVLIFKALEFRDGRLIGHSSLYGDVAVPTDSIQYLYMGDLERKTLFSPFEEWVVRSAQEPMFSPSYRPIDISQPAVLSPEAVPMESNQIPDIDVGNDSDVTADPKAPNLEKVRIDPQERSALVNQL